MTFARTMATWSMALGAFGLARTLASALEIDISAQLMPLEGTNTPSTYVIRVDGAANQPFQPNTIDARVGDVLRFEGTGTESNMTLSRVRVCAGSASSLGQDSQTYFFDLSNAVSVLVTTSSTQWAILGNPEDCQPSASFVVNANRTYTYDASTSSVPHVSDPSSAEHSTSSSPLTSVGEEILTTVVTSVETKTIGL